MYSKKIFDLNRITWVQFWAVTGIIWMIELLADFLFLTDTMDILCSAIILASIVAGIFLKATDELTAPEKEKFNDEW